MIMSRLARKEALTFYLMISPWLIGLLVFIIGPMMASLFFSFTRWDMLRSPKWIGLENYVDAFRNDPLFVKALQVTFTYSLFAVPLQLIASLLLALLLNQAVFGMRVFRTIFYMPAVVSGVSVMMLWVWIFNPEMGLLNTLLGYFNIEGPRWIYDVKWALPSLVLMSLWGVGSSMVIWLAGLQGVPTHLYEAAKIDGATTWGRFRNITIPMLTPTIFFNLVMGVISALQSFGEAYIMTGGGPLNSTLLYNFYVWRKAFTDYEMGYASALAWVLFVIILCLTLLIVRSSRNWVHYEGGRE